jgi:hypothetical protein
METDEQYFASLSEEDLYPLAEQYTSQLSRAALERMSCRLLAVARS